MKRIYYYFRKLHFKMNHKDLIKAAQDYGNSMKVEVYTDKGKEYFPQMIHISKSNKLKQIFFEEIGRIPYASANGIDWNTKSKFIFVSDMQMRSMGISYKLERKYILIAV